MLVFAQRGKLENLAKNLRTSQETEKQQQTQKLTYDTMPESNPGHSGGRQALSPLCHPCTTNLSHVTQLSRLLPKL